MPFAVWLFLAIEQLPLAAEESHDPQRDMPKGIIAGILTLIVSAFLVIFLNTGIEAGADRLAKSTEPLLDGFRALFGSDIAKILAAVAVIGLIASFHTIIFAFGRQIYSLSRAGYFPAFLSVTHGTRKSPHVALIAGAVLGLAVMLIIWFWLGAEEGGAQIGGTLLNMAVAGAMLAYFMQGMSYIVLKKKFAASAPALCEPLRDRRRGGVHDHRGGHVVLPAHRSDLSVGRVRRGDLLCDHDGIFPCLGPPQAYPLA